MSVQRMEIHQYSGVCNGTRACVHLASFLAVWEVAMSGKASGSEGLPWVWMLWSLKGEGEGITISGHSLTDQQIMIM